MSANPVFLIVPRDCKINVEPVPQVTGTPLKKDSVEGSLAWVGDSSGRLSKQAVPLEEYLAKLQIDCGTKGQQSGGQTRYDVSQKSNPDSITFLPGGIYKGE